MVGIGIVLPIIAILLSAFASYDKIMSKFIHICYTPDVQMSLDLPSNSNEFLREQLEGERNEHEIDHHELVDFNQDRQVELRLSVSNRTEKRIRYQLSVSANHIIRSRDLLYQRNPDTEDVVQVRSLDGPSSYAKQFLFQEVELSPDSMDYSSLLHNVMHESPSFGHSFLVDVDATADSLHTQYLMEVKLNIRIDASEFHIPVIRKQLPSSVGDIEFGSIRKEYMIDGIDNNIHEP
jgi:hypothetical protein